MIVLAVWAVAAVIGIFRDGCFAVAASEPSEDARKQDAMQKILEQLSPEQRQKMEAMMKDFGQSESSAPNKLPIKTARAMMDEIRREIASHSVRQAFKQRRDSGVPQESEDAFFHKMAPMAEMYVKRILEKYGFETGPGSNGKWGIQNAVTAAMEAAESDERSKSATRIMAALEDFNWVVFGTTGGRIPELDILADDFLKQTAEGQQAALRQAEATKGGELYAWAMKSVMTDGAVFITEALRKSEKDWEDEGQPKKRSQARARVNVLQTFVRDEPLATSNKGESQEL